MSASRPFRQGNYVENIRRAGISIYDPVEVGDPALWIPGPDLERLLDDGLRGISLAGMQQRTRSKFVKQYVCRVLGYPVPSAFPRTKPRFPGQRFDTYVQTKNNLQVWNEQLSPTRRYVVIRPSSKHIITKVKVVTGDTLAELDTTGTLTQKYQARFVVGAHKAELVSAEDTDWLRPFVSANVEAAHAATPTSNPTPAALLPIAKVYAHLTLLIGATFQYAGHDQRNRGGSLHRMICAALGYSEFQDDGQFPDVRNQLLEVKLQTSPTIDLGLVLPTSTEPLDMPKLGNQQIRHCDVRYAVFYAHTDGTNVKLTHLVLTTGEAFFSRFQQFQGKVLNKKLQIPLPRNFFD